MKITFVIRSLESGGAERQLTVLANELARRGHTISIVVFYPGGAREADVDRTKVRLISADKGSPADILPFLWRLLRCVRAEKPEILHGYLSAGNLAVLLARLAVPSARVFWGIRDSVMEFNRYSLTTRFTYRLAGLASRWADAMIFNSEAGRRYWRSRGCANPNVFCIANGIDTDRFAPDINARRRLREEWRIGENDFLIGMAARYDPVKGHTNFVRAAALISRQEPRARFVCVGTIPDAVIEDLRRLAAEEGAAGKVLFPGGREDMCSVYNALDLFVLPSRIGEGFPNVVGEAMACDIPCVVTDVGDAALVVGEMGTVVPQDDPDALAAAVLSVAHGTRRPAGEIRGRVLRHFTVQVLADRTEEALGCSGEFSDSNRETVGSHAAVRESACIEL